jgi:hypothetical protein
MKTLVFLDEYLKLILEFLQHNIEIGLVLFRLNITTLTSAFDTTIR